MNIIASFVSILMPYIRGEYSYFVPFDRILQQHYQRQRDTHFSAWRLRALFIQDLEEHQRYTRIMSTVTFLSDPFEGNITPRTTDGAQLFASATKDRVKDNLLMISQSKVTDIMATFRYDSNMFCCGKLLNTIVDNKGGHIRILEDFILCSLDLVNEDAARTWSKLGHKNDNMFTYNQKAAFDPANSGDDKIMFFRWVRFKIIVNRIEASLTSVLWKVMFGKRKHFTWMGTNGVAS